MLLLMSVYVAFDTVLFIAHFFEILDLLNFEEARVGQISFFSFTSLNLPFKFFLSLSDVYKSNLNMVYCFQSLSPIRIFLYPLLPWILTCKVWNLLPTVLRMRLFLKGGFLY